MLQVRQVKTTFQQMLVMVSAFENPNIFRLITGQVTNVWKLFKLEGANLRKKDGFATERRVTMSSYEKAVVENPNGNSVKH